MQKNDYVVLLPTADRKDSHTLISRLSITKLVLLVKNKFDFRIDGFITKLTR